MLVHTGTFAELLVKSALITNSTVSTGQGRINRLALRVFVLEFRGCTWGNELRDGAGGGAVPASRAFSWCCTAPWRRALRANPRSENCRNCEGLFLKTLRNVAITLQYRSAKGLLYCHIHSWSCSTQSSPSPVAGVGSAFALFPLRCLYSSPEQAPTKSPHGSPFFLPKCLRCAGEPWRKGAFLTRSPWQLSPGRNPGLSFPSSWTVSFWD